LMSSKAPSENLQHYNPTPSIFADKASSDRKNPLHEFTNNWITRCQRNFRAFCARSHSAINKTCASDGWKPSHTHGGERGGAYHCRRIKYLDVATRLQDVSKK
jgi:hypothetical protein